MDPTVTILIIVVVILLAAVIALGIMFAQRRRSDQLRSQFGPEYEHRLSETGDRKAVEADLQARRERRAKLDVRPLEPQERARFRNSWESIQRGFVDNPTGALHDAEHLVVEVMHVRGYPTDDADRRTEDISVDHPQVVRHYREAHAVQQGSANGATDTEQQRRALTAYRTLVEELLATDDAEHSEGHHADGPHADGHDSEGHADERTGVHRAHNSTGQETTR